MKGPGLKVDLDPYLEPYLGPYPDNEVLRSITGPFRGHFGGTPPVFSTS